MYIINKQNNRNNVKRTDVQRMNAQILSSNHIYIYIYIQALMDQQKKKL